MEEKTFYLNDPQSRVILIDPQVAVLIYGRRLGKSSEIIAHLSARRAYDMPGGSFLFLGRTYKQILERTLPATKSGWSKRGYIEGVHYVVGRPPLKNWPRPLYLPSSWEHSICWCTGTVFPLGSQDREGLVNSLTCHGLYADEAKFLDEKRFREDALPVVSAPVMQFPDSAHNRTIVLCTSMPSFPEGKWLFDYKRLMDREQIDLILRAAARAELLREKEREAQNESSRRVYASQLARLERVLLELRRGGASRKGSVYYDEASTLANVEVVGWDYIAQQKEVLGDRFESEILNIRPRTRSPFYAKLSARHFRSFSNFTAIDDSFRAGRSFTCLSDDYDRDAPLSVGMDFGANINCMVTAQREEGTRTLKVLKEHFVKDPQIQDDLLREWAEYYAPHRCKRVRLFYDNTGNNRTGFTELNRAQMARQILEGFGWRVDLMTRGGANIRHSHRHAVINSALSEEFEDMYRIRFNEPNCPALRESMRGVVAIEASDGTVKKDKSAEKKLSIPQEYAPHLSDAFDALFMGEFDSLISGMGEMYAAMSRLV